MSVVIVGGHDRMVSQYVKICKSFKCEATANSVTGHICVNSNSVVFWKRWIDFDMV